MFHQNLAGNKDDYDKLYSFECPEKECSNCTFICPKNHNPILRCEKEICDECGLCE